MSFSRSNDDAVEAIRMRAKILSDSVMAEIEKIESGEEYSLRLMFDCAHKLQECAQELDDDTAYYWQQALCVFEELIDRDYEEAQCHLKCAECWFRMGRFRKSRECAEKALKLDPEYAPAIQFLDMHKEVVRGEAKTLIYGLAGLAMIVGLFFAYSRSQNRTARR